MFHYITVSLENGYVSCYNNIVEISKKIDLRVSLKMQYNVNI